MLLVGVRQNLELYPDLVPKIQELQELKPLENADDQLQCRLDLEVLRKTTTSAKRAFDVFLQYARGLKPDLILSQWYHKYHKIRFTAPRWMSDSCGPRTVGPGTKIAEGAANHFATLGVHWSGDIDPKYNTEDCLGPTIGYQPFLADRDALIHRRGPFAAGTGPFPPAASWSTM